MIYIIANANATSGGPELLHQLCYKLSNKGLQASMVYINKWRFPAKHPGDEVKKKYSCYGCNYSKRIKKDENNIVVLPETLTFLMPKFKKMKIIIWWMSVDNYFASLSSKYRIMYAPFGTKWKKYNPFKQNVYHAVQSQYAFDFLMKHNVDENKIFYLTDYLSKEFIDETCNEITKDKKNVVLYNPKKGFEFTKKIMSESRFSWIALEKMTHQEMIDVLTTSKVYVDFGNHPGKDRIPREAAISGCLIITGKKGAASNKIDVMIPDEYKFDDEEKNIPIIIDKIQYLMDHYREKRTSLDSYRQRILQEEQQFEKDIDYLFSHI